MTQEALKLALEALDTIVDAIYINSQQEAEAVLKANDAITAIKEALAQHDSVQAKPEPEQEPVKYSDYEPDGVHHNKPPQRKPLTDEQIDALALVTWWTTK